MSSRHPEVKWAEREDKVYLTVLLPDAKNPKVNVDPEGTFTFSATAGTDNNEYELKFDLHDKVNVEECKINIGVRNIFCVLEKAEPKWWKKLLRGDGKTPHYVKVDWDKWVDEDDETGPADVDTGGMDFSKLGDMGGMGGLGGMGGMEGLGGLGGMGGMEGLGGLGGMGGLAGLGGMGGMGGMEGLGGMGGMGGLAGLAGMGDDAMGDDFEDSDEEDVKNEPDEKIKDVKEVGEASKDKAGSAPSS